MVKQVIQNKHLEVRMIDIYMEMLLHLDEDFDDDLLQEAITLLVDLWLLAIIKIVIWS